MNRNQLIISVIMALAILGGVWKYVLSENNSPPLEFTENGPSYEEQVGNVITDSQTFSREEILAEQDIIAESWFNFREGKESLHDFSDKFESSLEKGILPMVMDKFPLTLLDSSSQGFRYNVIPDPTGEIVLVTAMLAGEGTSEVFTYLVKGRSSSVERIDLGFVPEYFGNQSTDQSNYYFFAGERVDEKIYSEDSTLSIGALKVSAGSVELAPITFTEVLEGIDVETKDSLLHLKSSEDGYVYPDNEYVNEGQSTGELFINFIVKDQKLIYVVNVEDNSVQLKFMGGL